MQTFKSIRQLVWWLQNNGGGTVQIAVNPVMSDDAVTLTVGLTQTGEGSGAKGSFLNEAVTRIKI